MKLYQPPEPPKDNQLQLPQLNNTPQKFSHAELSLSQLQDNLQQRQLSSPIRSQIKSVFKGTLPLLAYGELVQLQLHQLQAQAKSQQIARTRNRQVVQQSGALTAEEAHERIAEKEAKKEAQKEKRCQFLIRVTRNKIKNEYKARGVIARRKERARVQKVKEFGVGNSLIPQELLQAIPDPEKALTEEDIELQVKEALISFPEFSGVVIPNSTITVGSTADLINPRVEFESQQDFVSIEDSFNIDQEEEIQFSLF